MIIVDEIEKLNKRKDSLYKFLEIEKKQTSIKKLQQETHSNNFWEDPNSAQKTLKQIKMLTAWVDSFNEIKKSLTDLEILFGFPLVANKHISGLALV